MGTSPNRRDLNGVFARSDYAYIDDKDLEKIEAQCRFQISEEQRGRLENILNGFLMHNSLQSAAPIRGDQLELLKKVEEASKLLADFLSSMDSPLKVTCRNKIAEELDIFKKPDANWEPYLLNEISFKEIRQRFWLMLRRRKRVVHFETVANDLKFIHTAALQRINKFSEGFDDDTGSPNEDLARMGFLDALRRFYEDCGGKRSFERFVICCHDILPEHNRPELPDKPGSITRAANRAKKYWLEYSNPANRTEPDIQ